MTLDWLNEPISDDEPAGPDLEAADDAGFLDYYYEAEALMPERYFTPGIKSDKDEFAPGALFDKKSISLKDHNPKIEGLLKRSRDLRLLSLQARLCILAGDLTGFVDALEGTADVLAAFPADVNPKDLSDKRGALDELGNSVVVGIPLQYTELAGPGEVSYRRMQVALGKSEPRQGELGLDPGKLSAELASPGNAKAVDAAHALLSRAAGALARIKEAGLLNDPPFNPAVDPTMTTIADIQAMIANARPDLTPWSAEEAAATESAASDDPAEDDGGTAADGGDGPTPVAAAPVAAPTVVTAIPSRTAALRTLSAVEAYFATHEPAAPALLLITQARLLVGKPLIEAIETLLPADAPRVMIDFGPATGFKMDMNRLKMLAGESASLAGAVENEDPGEDPVVGNRADVAGHLSALEEFFRAREPASPIPVLLFRARSYLEKDFAAIVAELIPPPAETQSE
ncbi:ImpA family type VI secretion system protein [Yoonia sp. R2331]|uniref:type VI secretion system protein TssA n=1 Tax=Yoonia sp. R2331 TaxID=3237238 RepID=UPI0034E4B4AB